MTNTREKFIAVATTHFADRGFYGASVAQISADLNLSKQALLHHFGSKEKLYAEVLQAISDRLMKALADIAENQNINLGLTETVFTNLFRVCRRDKLETQLLVRELLDNKQRATTANKWYLKEFLSKLSDLVKQDKRAESLDQSEIFLLNYQLLGAINYFLISENTLRQMLGKNELASYQGDFEKELIKLIQSRLK